MTTQELKNSILQYAVQGKLVPQNPHDEPASELLKKIKAEIEQLIKDKKVKAEKPIQPIKEDDNSFTIPESWEWVRLGEIISLNSGQDLLPSQYSDVNNSGIPYITGASNIDNGNIIVNRWTTTPKSIANKGDLLLTCKGTVGKIAYLQLNRVHIARQIMSIKHFLVDYKYISIVLETQIESYKQKANSFIPGIDRNIVLNTLFPLPPLAEQQRIVDKIEELMPLVEQYGKAEAELKELNKAFPEKIKKSALQYGIQGKLVPQNPQNEPASVLLEKIKAEKQKLIREKKIKADKPLPAITEKEIPFEIPDGWAWIRLGDLTSKIGSGSTPTGGKAVYLTEGIKFIRSQNVYNDGLRLDNIAYISEKTNQAKKGSIVLPDDILLNITGASIGRCAIVPSDFDTANINQHVMIIRLIDKSIIEYLHFCLTSNYIQSKIMDVQVGVSREGLSATKLMEFLIPLPPLSEQKLIVEKVEELFSYCNKLK